MQTPGDNRMSLCKIGHGTNWSNESIEDRGRDVVQYASSSLQVKSPSEANRGCPDKALIS